MKAVTKIARNMVLAVAAVAAGSLFQPAAAPAATAAASAVSSLPSLVAYVRRGDVYVSRNATETRLTTDGGYSRPRWSPDGKHIAFLKDGRLWTMTATGTAKHRLTTRAASGPSWAPDGKTIAFASLSCIGGPGVFRISATVPNARPQALFPTECRTEPLPAEPAITVATGALSDRLRVDNAVAWSPDGTRVAFRGGDCESIYDACLSIGTVTTGAEKTVAAYGGGSLQTSGFAVVPSWRSDGAKLSWTAAQQGETRADDEPVHVVEYDTVTGAKRTVGASLDREMAYVDATRGVATGQNQGGSWVMVVSLANGSRTAFHPGSQPSVRPTR
jgi:dipeptidyl aminopeptidase/acylaminoacyl peptidase